MNERTWAEQLEDIRDEASAAWADIIAPLSRFLDRHPRIARLYRGKPIAIVTIQADTTESNVSLAHRSCNCSRRHAGAVQLRLSA